MRIPKWLTGAAGALVLACGSAQAADAISLRLNWQILGFHAPFYWGVEKGFYRDEGIDLTVNEGRGGAATAQAIAAGSDTFGIVDAGTVIVSNVRGLPIRTVMSLMNGGIFAIVTRKDANITKAKDLEGKTIAATAGDGLTQLFPAILSVNKLDGDKIRLVNVDPAGKVVSVLEKRADALLGSIDAQSFAMEAKGVPAGLLSYDDLGVKLVGLTIVANETTIGKNPDLIKRFVRATRKTFEEAAKAPDAPIQFSLKVKPELDAKVMRQQMDVSVDKFVTAATKGHPLGWGATSDWDNTVALLKQYQELKTDKTGAAFFTNDFVN